MDLNTSKGIRIKIMDYLAIRDHSKKEILRKMSTKVDNFDLLHKEMDKLELEGYINEERFAHEYIRSRIVRGYGSIKIQSELKIRGIKDEKIVMSLSSFRDMWIETAIKVLKKKFPLEKLKGDDYHKDNLRKKRFLAYRGFNFDEINKALEDSKINS